MKNLFISSLDENLIKRSGYVSIIVTTITYLVNKFSTFQQKELLFFIEYLFGMILTYVTDILFVQNIFKVNDKFVKIPYNNFNHRLRYIFNHEILYKFLVVITISSIINKNIYIYIIKILDRYKVLHHNPVIKSYRDLGVQLLINMFTTLMFVNIIKYKWAYIDFDDMHLTMIILTWFSLVILISVANN